MRRTNIWLACGLLVAIVLGMFIYTYFKQKALESEPVVTDTTVIVDETANPLITRIDAKHFYQDGAHTIAGEVVLPTPCDLLTYEATVAESYPEQILFKFAVINNSVDCEATPTTQRFIVSATASPAASMKASFNGQPIELNLIEAAPGESPADFELYLKG